MFGPTYHRSTERTGRKEYAENLLQKVGLLDEVKDRLNEPANKLSGGQLQRLSLARTIANQPEIILMDEPCSSLDPISAKRIEDFNN